MDDLHPFRSLSIGHPILRLSYFRLWPWNSKVKVMGVGQRARSYSWPRIILQNTSQFFQQNLPKLLSNNVAMFCRSGPMSGSHLQTRKFLLIDATAMTLGQGHGKVIRYISPDPCILYAKYLRFSWNSFDVRGKSFCSGGGGGRGGNELKT